MRFVNLVLGRLTVPLTSLVALVLGRLASQTSKGPTRPSPPLDLDLTALPKVQCLLSDVSVGAASVLLLLHPLLSLPSPELVKQTQGRHN